MKLYNLKDHNEQVSFAQAVTQGLGKNQGLFFPHDLPEFQLTDIDELLKQDFVTRSAKILSAFIGDEIPQDVLQQRVTVVQHNSLLAVADVVNRAGDSEHATEFGSSILSGAQCFAFFSTLLHVCPHHGRQLHPAAAPGIRCGCHARCQYSLRSAASARSSDVR